MRKRKALLVLILINFFFSKEINASSFYIDKNFSPHCSANNFLQVQDLALNAQNNLTREKKALPQDLKFSDFLSFSNLYQYSDLSDWQSKGLLKIGGRTAELGLVWQPLSLITTVIQHEVFGHGYRIRDLGPKAARVSKYTLNFGFGKSGLNIKKASTLIAYKRLLSPTEKLSVQIAGMQAEAILAHDLIMDWLEKGEIDGRQASLWHQTNFGAAEYIRTLRKDNGFEIFCRSQFSGHDVANYLELLNQTYYMGESIDSQIKDYRFHSMMTYIFNPFTYLSYYSQITYALFNRTAPIPGAMSGSLKLLPVYQFALTPFGPESIFELYIWDKGKTPIYAYLKSSKINNVKYIGFGLESRNMYNLKFGNLGFKLNLWNQPKMLLNPSTMMLPYHTFFYCRSEKFEFCITPDPSILDEDGYNEEQFGGAIAIIYNYSFKDPMSNVFVELGYKTQGYLPGEALLQSPIIKLGMQLKF